MYLCGPTVYDHAHLGHGRSAVAFDVIRRYLEYVYGEANVRFVTNYTDIDDKMIHRAAEEGITVKQLAEKIIPEYEKDYGALGIKPPTVQTKATDQQYIDSMIEIVGKLLEKGHAYELDDGVYFDISTFKDYGKLSGQKQEELQAGARVETDTRKRHPHDFVLWKKEKPGEPSWDSPWSKGRPGWHIECSAMSRVELGQPFDIHAGGMDLTFPHHECEIAQSEAAYDTPFCKVWLHNGFITVNKEKMSKSLGNFFTLKDIFKKYNPRVVRLFYLSTHYRSPIEFSDTQLEQAKNTLARIDDFERNSLTTPNDPIEENPAINAAIEKLKKLVKEKMDDDFDTPGALAALFEFIREINRELFQNEKGIGPGQAETLKKEFTQIRRTILGIPDTEEAQLSSEQFEKIETYKRAKAQKDYTTSDQIRNELNKEGILLEDTPHGTIWKIDKK